MIGPPLDARGIAANRRGRMTPRQAVGIILKQVGTGWLLTLFPATIFPPGVVVLVPAALALTPIFVVAAAVECALKLRSEDGAIERESKQRLFIREHHLWIGDRAWSVSRKVHDGLVDGAVYRLYLTRLSNVIVNYERLETTEPVR